MTTHIAILAGGRSSRFGSDKAEVLIDGIPLLVRTATLSTDLVGTARTMIIGRHRPDGWNGPPVQFLVDAHRGEGPMSGLVAALEHLPTGPDQELLVLPCDLPWLTAQALAWLTAQSLGMDGMVGSIDGVLQPLAARYRPSVLPNALDDLANGKRSLWRLVTRLDFHTVDVPPDLRRAFTGVNQLTDLGPGTTG